jgi:hypothetical protein
VGTPLCPSGDSPTEKSLDNHAWCQHNCIGSAGEPTWVARRLH